MPRDEGGAVGMSMALSVDLRERVVVAIAAGASCRAAAARFGSAPQA
ncbi:MAG TPA: hypothetical protein VIL69_24630 [Roseomonas sp.]